MWAPLYDYQAKEAAEGRGMAPEPKHKRSAEPAGEEEAAQPVRRSARATTRQRYDEPAEEEEEEEEEQEEAAPAAPVTHGFLEQMCSRNMMFDPPPTQLSEDLHRLMSEVQETPWHTESGAPACTLLERCSSSDSALPPTAAAEHVADFWKDFDLDFSEPAVFAQNDEPQLAPAALPAAAAAAASEQDCALSLNETGAAAFYPSAGHWARSDGAAGSTVPEACLTPSSRSGADPRDVIIVESTPLLHVAELMLEVEMKHSGISGGLKSGSAMLRTASGLVDDDVEAARARLDGISAHVHKQWPGVRCMLLMLRTGALNMSELAGCVFVGAAEESEKSAALQYAESALCELLGC